MRQEYILKNNTDIKFVIVCREKVKNMRKSKYQVVLFLTLFLCVLFSFCANAYVTGYYTYEIIDSQAILKSVNPLISGKVTIPARLGGYYVVEIRDDAFKDCTQMTAVVIPDDISIISGSAFSGCANLGSISVSSGNKSFCDKDGILFDNNATAIIKYPYDYTGETYNTPESVITINNNAFSECNNLKKLVVSNAECSVYDSADTIDPDVIICAPKNSSAHKYAEKYNRTFEVYCLHTDQKTTDKVEPGCETIGYTAGVYCNGCETYLSGHDVIAYTGHKWNSGQVKSVSTCKTEGVVEYTCLNDASHKHSEKLPINYTNHVGDTYVCGAESPNCSEKGYTGDVFCSGCNLIIDMGDYIGELGHSISEWTYKENGTHTGYCSRIGCEHSETYDCDYDEWSVSKESTCTENGIMTRKCMICHYTERAETDFLGHKPGDTVIENKIDVSCVENGSFDEVVYCERCSDELSRKSTEIPYKGHSYTSELTEAAVDSDGKIVYTCKCGDSYIEEICRVDALSLSCSYYKYDGKNKTPKLTVKDSQGNTLVKNKDYKIIVSSKRNTIGRYTVKVNFIGLYTGTKNVFFYILPGETENVNVESYTDTSVTLKWDDVVGATSYKVYRYSPSRKAYVLAANVTDNKATVDKLYKATSYDFRVVTCGKTTSGKLYDSRDFAEITASTCTATPVLRLASTAKGRVTIAWNNVSGETGYQIFYSASEYGGFKKLSNYKADTIKIYKTGLESGKTYYFKVRTYIKTDRGYVYSPFSQTKSLIIR